MWAGGWVVGGWERYLEAFDPGVEDAPVQAFDPRDQVVEDDEGGGMEEAGEGTDEVFHRVYSNHTARILSAIESATLSGYPTGVGG